MSRPTVRSGRPPVRGSRLVVASVVVAALSFVWLLGLGLYGIAERSSGEEVAGLDRDESAETSAEGDGAAARPGSVEAIDEASQPGNRERQSSSRRAVFVRFAIIFMVPTVSLGFALLTRTRRTAIAARGGAVIVLIGMVVLTISSAGVGFAIAAVLMAIATVQATTEPGPDRST